MTTWLRVKQTENIAATVNVLHDELPDLYTPTVIPRFANDDFIRPKECENEIAWSQGAVTDDLSSTMEPTEGNIKTGRNQVPSACMYVMDPCCVLYSPFCSRAERNIDEISNRKTRGRHLFPDGVTAKSQGMVGKIQCQRVQHAGRSCVWPRC